MRYRFLSILYLMVCVASCKKHEASAVYPINREFNISPTLSADETVASISMDNSKVIQIEVPLQKKSYNFDDYVASYHYIHLETNEKSLLGNIDKLCTDSSVFFIFDKKNSSVLRFSYKGKFLGMVGKKGRGPGEYINLHDMSIDKHKHTLCLLDLGGGKLLYYDYEGRFLHEQPLYYYYNQFEFLNDKLVLSTSYSNNGNYPTIDCNRLVLSLQNQTPILKGFPFPNQMREKFHWEFNQPLMSYKNRVFYHHILSDTIWEVQESKCIARYFLKFAGRNNLFEKKDIQNISDEIFSSVKKKNVYFMGHFLQNDDLMFFSITDESQMITPLFYSKQSGKILYGSASSHSEDNFLDRLSFNSLDFALDEGSFVKVIQPFDALRILKLSEQVKENLNITEKDRTFIRNIREEDNPVLLILNIKPF